jgi:hypothetical protein
MLLNYIGKPVSITNNFAELIVSPLPVAVFTWVHGALGDNVCLDGSVFRSFVPALTHHVAGVTHNFAGALLTRFWTGFMEVIHFDSFYKTYIINQDNMQAAFFPGALFLISKVSISIIKSAYFVVTRIEVVQAR